jgi:hypothetical protein
VVRLQQYSLLTADCRCHKPFSHLKNMLLPWLAEFERLGHRQGSPPSVYRPLQETMQQAGPPKKILGHTDICMTQQKLEP